MTVRFEAHDGVALITLDRPETLNALDLDALNDLRDHLARVRDRDDLRVAILTGAGSRAFCVGADLKATAASAASYAEGCFKPSTQAAKLGLYIRLMDLTDLELQKPVIAAVNGHCLGAGLEIALQCDLRIASNGASFGLPEAKVGSIPAVSGLHRLLRAVPASNAMQMVLTGEPLLAGEAHRIGLVSELTAPADLLERAMVLARTIAGNAPLAVQAVKRLSRQTSHLSEADAQRMTELYWGILRDTEDRREGRLAFAEKRRPHYTGR